MKKGYYKYRNIFIALLLLLLVVPHQVRGMMVQQDSLPIYLSVKLMTAGDRINLAGYNSNYGPLTAFVKLEDNDSVIVEKVIAPNDSAVLLVFPMEKKELLSDSLNEKLNFGYYLGDAVNVSPDINYLYRFPFREKRSFRISQGPNGKFTHNHPVSRYAIDFDLRQGEKVHAAREGIVVTSIDWFNKNGGPELKMFANRIVVLHNDGTLASYVHLAPNGSLVEEGQYVSRGEHIGYSGNTGYSRGPHLHFVVRTARDISIPVRFSGFEQKELKDGMKVRVDKDRDRE